MSHKTPESSARLCCAAPPQKKSPSRQSGEKSDCMENTIDGIKKKKERKRGGRKRDQIRLQTLDQPLSLSFLSLSLSLPSFPFSDLKITPLLELTAVSFVLHLSVFSLCMSH